MKNWEGGKIIHFQVIQIMNYYNDQLSTPVCRVQTA